MERQPLKKSGISKQKPIICSRCGKKVGWVTLKMRFRARVFFWGFILIFITQLISEWIVNWMLFGGATRILQ